MLVVAALESVVERLELEEMEAVGMGLITSQPLRELQILAAVEAVLVALVPVLPVALVVLEL
jgi:hypothetical protein